MILISYECKIYLCHLQTKNDNKEDVLDRLLIVYKKLKWA